MSIAQQQSFEHNNAFLLLNPRDNVYCKLRIAMTTE